MAWNLLFSSDIGLLSLFTIGFVIAMAIFMIRFASKHAEIDARNEKLTQK
jgi:hypothetical protein